MAKPQATPPFFAKLTAPDTTAQPPAAAPAQAVAPDTMAKPPAQPADLPKLPEAQQTTEGKPQPAATTTTPPDQPSAGSPPLSEDEYIKQHPELIPPRPTPSWLSQQPTWKRAGVNGLMGALSGFMNMGTRPGVDPRTHPNNSGADFLQKWQANQKAAADAPAQYDQNLAKMRADAYNTYLKQQGDVAGIGEKQANTVKAGADSAEAQARADALRNALKNPPLKEEKKIDEYTNDQGHRVEVMQRPDNSTYERVSGGNVQKPPEKTGAEKPEIEAQIGPKPATSVYQGKDYGTPEKAQAAWGKDYEKGINREAYAAGQDRGNAYAMGRLAGLQKVYDTADGNRPKMVSGNDILADPGRYLPEAPGTTQALKATATLEDIRAGVTQLRPLVAQLDKGFEDRGKMAAAMIQGGGAFSQFAIGELDRGNLTEKQYEYVDAVNSMIERAMTLRQVAGMGAGSDELRRAIVNALPGPGTPNSKQANDKLDRLEDVINRLEQGVPDVPLKPNKQQSGGGTPSAGGGTPPSANAKDPGSIY